MEYTALNLQGVRLVSWGSLHTMYRAFG